MTNSNPVKTGDAVISIRGVSMSYGARRVLDQVDLDVCRGEILVLLGGSGSGKSTLLKPVLGLAKPEAGSITIDGVDITCCSPSELGAVQDNSTSLSPAIAGCSVGAPGTVVAALWGDGAADALVPKLLIAVTVKEWRVGPL